MSEIHSPGSGTGAPSADASALIESLRARGAERFDAVGFRFIEALARRAEAHRDGARRVIEGRLANALAEFDRRWARARSEASAEQDRPQAPSGFAELLAHVRELSSEASVGVGEPPASLVEATGELKAMRYFRRTWSKLSVDRQLSHAVAQAPENAGPLNSHFLALQALKFMRDLSPDCLSQFMSYFDALLWLDRVESVRAPVPKSGGRGERKRKPGRGIAG